MAAIGAIPHDAVAGFTVLGELNHFKGTHVVMRPKPTVREAPAAPPDLKDIKGQESAKRALEIAAPSAHNLLTVCRQCLGRVPFQGRDRRSCSRDDFKKTV
jgi:predicted ATPase with chaperone activity